MGNDQHHYPHQAPPIWEQVKALSQRYEEMRHLVKDLNGRIKELQAEGEAKDRTIARLSVQISGAPFPGEPQ